VEVLRETLLEAHGHCVLFVDEAHHAAWSGLCSRRHRVADGVLAVRQGLRSVV